MPRVTPHYCSFLHFIKQEKKTRFVTSDTKFENQYRSDISFYLRVHQDDCSLICLFFFIQCLIWFDNSIALIAIKEIWENKRYNKNTVIEEEERKGKRARKVTQPKIKMEMRKRAGICKEKGIFEYCCRSPGPKSWRQNPGQSPSSLPLSLLEHIIPWPRSTLLSAAILPWTPPMQVDLTIFYKSFNSTQK